MSFEIRCHDVTCLCALVGLPKVVIVEELGPRGGRHRFQLQAFVAGPLAEALGWLEPVLDGGSEGLRVVKWSGAFEFARVEVEGVGAAARVRRALQRVEERGPGGLRVAVNHDQFENEEVENSDGDRIENIEGRLTWLSNALALNAWRPLGHLGFVRPLRPTGPRGGALGWGAGAL